MKRRNFLKQAMVVGGGALIAAPSFIGMVNRRNGFWQQQDSGLWSLKQADPIFASSIITRNIGGIDDKRISLSNSNFARLLPASLGTWTKIRLALRVNWNYGGSTAVGSLGGARGWFFGLCSGTSAIFLDASTTNCIGWMPVAANTQLEYLAVSGGNSAYFYTNNGQKFSKRVGTTTTQTASAAESGNFPINNTGATRRLLFADITKGSPNYTGNEFESNSQTTATDIDVSTFLSAAGSETPSVTGHILSAARTLAFDEVAGALDALCVAWSPSAATFEICDIAIAKFA